MSLKLSTYQIGTAAKRSQGLRIGATRLPPRGVPKSRWAHDRYFDVWLPVIAPSMSLLRWIKQRDITDPKTRRTFKSTLNKVCSCSLSGTNGNC